MLCHFSLVWPTSFDVRTRLCLQIVNIVKMLDWDLPIGLAGAVL